MLDSIRQLLEIQDRDQRLAKLEAQLRAVPVEKKRAETELLAGEQGLATVRDQIRTAEKIVKSVELDIETVRIRMRDFQSKSAMIKSNDEYKAALHQIETCRLQVVGLEDKQLVAMGDLEKAKYTLEQENHKLEATRQRVKSAVEDLETRARNCRLEVEKMRAARKPFLEALPPEICSRYERMRSGRGAQDPNYRALVPVRSGTCGGCNMNVTAQIRVNAVKGQLPACANCGRLLFVEE